MYTMMQVCRKLDMTYQTLKYYCNEGLVPNVKRDKNNYRVFDENNIAWINSLSCLKNCDMTINEMKEYLQLCLKGEETIPERQRILEKKLKKLEHKVQKINESIDFIHWKQNFYEDVLNGKVKYFSNLIQKDDDLSK